MFITVFTKATIRFFPGLIQCFPAYVSERVSFYSLRFCEILVSVRATGFRTSHAEKC